MFRSPGKHVQEVETEDGVRSLTFYPLSYNVTSSVQPLLGAVGSVFGALAGYGEFDRALKLLLERLVAERLLLAHAVMDSLRDEFPRPIKPPEIAKFAEGTDGPMMMHLLDGVVQANKGLFAPFLARLTDAVTASRDGVAKLKEATSAAAGTT